MVAIDAKVKYGFAVVFAEDIREFKQIATAGADTATGSKFPPKWDTAHVRELHPILLRVSGCFAVVATTLGFFRFSRRFQRTSRHFKNSIGYYIL